MLAFSWDFSGVICQDLWSAHVAWASTCTVAGVHRGQPAEEPAVTSHDLTSKDTCITSTLSGTSDASHMFELRGMGVWG